MSAASKVGEKCFSGVNMELQGLQEALKVEIQCHQVKHRVILYRESESSSESDATWILSVHLSDWAQYLTLFSVLFKLICVCVCLGRATEPEIIIIMRWSRAGRDLNIYEQPE